MALTAWRRVFTRSTGLCEVVTCGGVFLQNGCEGEQFKEVTQSGEYIVICKGEGFN